MPKFAKGSPEAVQFMKDLRAKRGSKRPINTHKQVSKEHIQNIVNEALEKYYMTGTPIVEIPSQVVNVDKSGNAKLVTTLTKAGNLKKVNGENVIKLESGDDLVVQTKGTKYNEAVNVPSQTIVHKPHEKTTRKKIVPTVKESNDEAIEMKHENIPIQKITHNPKQKTIRRASIQPCTDIIEVGNVDIEPLKKTTKSTQKIIKTRPKN
jgi:phosphosulfolactate synthase (CoM biosynthesis protein A)